MENAVVIWVHLPCIHFFIPNNPKDENEKQQFSRDK